MRRILLVVAASLVAACGDEPPAERPDTLSARSRDSVIGASGLPGAGGVRGALGAADSAAARNARLDSIGRP